jgi:hypothetical protein
VTKKRSAIGTLGWVAICLGAIGMLGALAILATPGLSTAAPVAFGERLTVDVSAGDHAVYVTPSDEWDSITCTGRVGDDELGLRPSMIQQDLWIPARLDAQGSFDARAAGTVVLTCDGPVESATFTIGPVLSFWHLAAATLLGIAALTVAIMGIALVFSASVTRKRARTFDASVTPKPDRANRIS